jgi:hypothetical protein
LFGPVAGRRSKCGSCATSLCGNGGGSRRPHSAQGVEILGDQWKRWSLLEEDWCRAHRVELDDHDVSVSSKLFGDSICLSLLIWNSVRLCPIVVIMVAKYYDDVPTASS